jgi:hypothetical protein
MKPTALACSVRGEILTGLSETEAAIGPTAFVIGVVVILAVVLPEAHGADLVHATFAKGEVSAARTPVRLVPGRPVHVEEHALHCPGLGALTHVLLPGRLQSLSRSTAAPLTPGEPLAGCAPAHPDWHTNLVADPDVTV